MPGESFRTRPMAVAVVVLVAAGCAGSGKQALIAPVEASAVRDQSAAVDISAYTARSSGRVVFDGRIQFVSNAWQLSPRGYGAQRFSLPDSELVSVEPAASDSLSGLIPWALGGLLLAGAVVGIAYIGLGGSDP